MVSVVLLGSFDNGHQNCVPRETIIASSDVFVESIGSCRVGDDLNKHCNHTGYIAIGSSTVNVNGIPMATVGSNVSCGSMMATGSDTVNIGE